MDLKSLAKKLWDSFNGSIDNEIRELYKFVQESNSIEDINRKPFDVEIEELNKFMLLTIPTIDDLCHFVSVYEPNARLRTSYGDSVRVRTYIPPFGGPEIATELESLLKIAPFLHPYDLHRSYEMLHPFTDCNGRSGRALWAWKTRDISRGFLLPWYFMSLEKAKGNEAHKK
jgi:hypothetical protein